MFFFFFFKQKTAYEMRISDWSSDVCSSDLAADRAGGKAREERVDRVLVGGDAADDVRNDVHDMAVELDGIAVGDAHAAADRSAADVVAAEVEQHQLHGAFLGIGAPAVALLDLPGAGGAARGGAGDGRGG